MYLTSLRAPDIEITALKIWVHGRESEESYDYSGSGNWISATALCDKGGASVQVDGSFLHLSEIAEFLNKLMKLNETLQGEALLSCMEGNLGIRLSFTDSHGNINAEIELTPDPMTQRHSFIIPMDQSYLPGIINDFRRVLTNYPIRGSR